MTIATPATPLEAEAAFYAAFEARDLDALMTLWADDETIVCVHPLGSLLLGPQAIRQSWQAIFAHSPPMRFRIERQLSRATAELAIHTVFEHIEVLAPPHSRQSVMATNAYRRGARGWRMILHHASPAAAERREPTLH